jgi:dienelactone hydrolase
MPASRGSFAAPPHAAINGTAAIRRNEERWVMLYESAQIVPAFPAEFGEVQRRHIVCFSRDNMKLTRENVLIATPAEQVPGILICPSGGPHPAALLLHGLSSTKEKMADSVGLALAKRGIASLAIDLPLHGEREGTVRDLSPTRPFAIISHWRLAVTDSTAALDFLADHRSIDASSLAVVGYSLGAFLSVQIASGDSRIEAVVLAAGGDLPDDLPFQALVRSVADPVKAIRRMNKPVLMINGQFDRTVAPAQARRLHEAAREPKTIRWYRGGHWPPASEIDAAAEWISQRFSSARRQAV